MRPTISQIGKWLAAQRARAGLSQSVAARRAGINSPDQISKWERGDKMPETDNFVALVLAYNADVRTFDTFDWDAEPVVATGFLAITDEDLADPAAPAVSASAPADRPSGRVPSGVARGASSRSPTKPRTHGGKGKGR